MIKEVIFHSRACVPKLMGPTAPCPPILLPEFYANIFIADPKLTQELPKFADWIKPSLYLSFSDINPPGESLAKDPLLRKQLQQKIESKHIIIPTERGAEKILAYCNAFESSSYRWCIFIGCETGRTNSAAIAKVLKWASPKILVKGTLGDSFDFANQYLVNLLTQTFGKLSAVHDSNANLGSATRG